MRHTALMHALQSFLIKSSCDCDRLSDEWQGPQPQIFWAQIYSLNTGRNNEERLQPVNHQNTDQ